MTCGFSRPDETGTRDSRREGGPIPLSLTIYISALLAHVKLPVVPVASISFTISALVLTSLGYTGTCLD